MRRYILLGLLCLCATILRAQLYTGESGLIHVPSAEMHKEGDVRIGMYFMNKKFTPDGKGFAYKRERYNTTDYYLSITPLLVDGSKLYVHFAKDIGRGT